MYNQMYFVTRFFYLVVCLIIGFGPLLNSPKSVRKIFAMSAEYINFKRHQLNGLQTVKKHAVHSRKFISVGRYYAPLSFSMTQHGILLFCTDTLFQPCPRIVVFPHKTNLRDGGNAGFIRIFHYKHAAMRGVLVELLDLCVTDRICANCSYFLETCFSKKSYQYTILVLSKNLFKRLFKYRIQNVIKILSKLNKF